LSTAFQAQNAARDATDLVSKLMTWHHAAFTDPNKHANNTRYIKKQETKEFNTIHQVNLFSNCLIVDVEIDSAFVQMGFGSVERGVA
jgi:hypothetical protein